MFCAYGLYERSSGEDVELVLAILSAHCHQLVAQYDALEILGTARTHDKTDQTGQQPIQNTEHGRTRSRRENPRSKPETEYRAPTRMAILRDATRGIRPGLDPAESDAPLRGALLLISPIPLLYWQDYL